MATLADSLVTTITTEWGNGGGGGAAPAQIKAHADVPTDYAPTTEQIIVRLPIHATRRPINDTYANVKHSVLIRVKTSTSDTRLYEIVDELRWIINNVAVTGITRQFCSGGEDKTDAGRAIFIYDMRVTCEEHMASSAAAYSAGTATTFEVDELTVNTSIAGSPTAALGVTTFAADSLTSTLISDLLMFGSANAAWVNCPLEGWNPTAAGTMSNIGEWENVDNTNAFISYAVPLPTNRGGLKLYISGTRISLSDADGGDYITNTYLEAYGSSGKSNLDLDITDKNSAGLKTDTFTAVDTSAYYAIKVRLQTVNTNAADLNIQYVLAQCYYAA